MHVTAIMKGKTPGQGRVIGGRARAAANDGSLRPDEGKGLFVAVPVGFANAADLYDVVRMMVTNDVVLQGDYTADV